MGWGRYLFLGNLGQQLDLSDQKGEIEALRDELSRNRDGSGRNVERLQAENDELRLYFAAVVRLLMSKGILSREEIRQVVDAVDKEDGRRDGKFKGTLG